MSHVRNSAALFSPQTAEAIADMLSNVGEVINKLSDSSTLFKILAFLAFAQAVTAEGQAKNRINSDPGRSGLYIVGAAGLFLCVCSVILCRAWREICCTDDYHHHNHHQAELGQARHEDPSAKVDGNSSSDDESDEKNCQAHSHHDPEEYQSPSPR